MGNCIFAYPDRTLAATLSGGSWLSALPLTQLQDNSDSRMSSLARSADLASGSTVILGDFGTDRDIRIFAVLRHNATSAATVRLQLYSDAGRTVQVADTGVLPLWPPFYPPGSLPWGHPAAWTGGAITTEDLAGEPLDFHHVFPAPVVCRAFKVTFSDPANPDGYFELARLMLAPGWQSPYGFDFGSGVQWVDPSAAVKSLGGVRYYDRKSLYRTVTGKLDLTEAVGAGWWMEMQRRLGVTGELFFVYDPDDAYQALKQRSFLASFRELSPLENPYLNRNSVAFALEEVL